LERLVLLIAAAGVLPFLVGWTRLAPAARGASPRPPLGSVLACTLAFNLSFFWQELWLVVPKALTPGLSPILFHNDHDWTGSAPDVELLQGTGALATFASGLASLALLSVVRKRSATARVFVWWLAFQGLFQSLTQVAVGSLLPRNDVGRALGYFGVEGVARMGVLGASLLAMAGAGVGLAACAPPGLAAAQASGTRTFALALLATAIACVLLCVPFREPRNAIEVVLIPAVVNLIGIGWVVFGAGVVRREERAWERPGVRWPVLALVALLVVFQVVLRPGVRF
jgi:hypothetical protein